MSVENASYRWAYMILAYGLLFIVAYRGFVAQESNWDLMALVIGGSLAATIYPAAHHILSRRAWIAVAVIMVVSAIVAALSAFFLVSVRGSPFA